MTTHFGDTPIVFGDKRQPKALPLSHPKARWGEFGRQAITLPKGYTRRPGCLSLPCDILFERDVPVQLRDGTKVFVDVYRPVHEENKCPAILAWSPYGKQGGRGNQVLDDFPFRMGVPLSKLSELQKWEGPDPAYWVHQGYAVINADPRGVGKSEGNIYEFGSQEGRDGADVVDWVGQQTWCSGKVGMSGNSYLAISQWFIAAQRPQHLAAMAPWEGLSDLYGEGIAFGGVLSKPGMEFNLQLTQVNAGENSWENPVQMALDHPLFSEYHDDKRAEIEKIQVPAYVVASWSNPIHSYGTFRAYVQLKTKKWLRIHDSWEWPDYYTDRHVEDLRRFFDFYLKDIKNGWDLIPKVRAKIMDPINPLPLTGLSVTFDAFPPPKMCPMTLFFDGVSRELHENYPSQTSVTYEANKNDVSFTYTFAENCVLCGPIEMKLAVSLNGVNDSDIFVSSEKIPINKSRAAQLKIPYEKCYQSWIIRAANAVGIAPETKVLFYQGPWGGIRVSRRTKVTTQSVDGFPISSMKEYLPVEENEIVEVEPLMWPIGMSFLKGEALRFHISGKDPTTYPPIDQATLTVEDIPNVNSHGFVNIHCGPQEGSRSFVKLPVVPI